MPAGSQQPNVGLLIAGRYRTTDVIGRGGQSMVCRADDTKTGEAVAVKILRSAAATDPQAAGRFQREQQALMALAGSNVVRVIDTCRLESGALCLVMELLLGESLEQRLSDLEAKHERLPLRDVSAIIEPIVDTLEKAHGLGIIHRDLKPGNIFLLSKGGVRLLDFGFARLKSAVPLTAAGMVMGSPSYIAPEVWRGTPNLVDHRADVYSLAVILFRMLAGQLPLWSESMITMLALATTGARPSLKALRPDLPDDVDLWVHQALAVDPEQRFHSASALLKSLQTVTGSGPRTSGLGVALRSAAQAVKRWAIRDVSERRVSRPGASPPANDKPAPEADDVAVEAPTRVMLAPARPPPAPPSPAPSPTSPKRKVAAAPPPKGRADTSPPLTRAAAPVTTRPAKRKQKQKNASRRSGRPGKKR